MDRPGAGSKPVDPATRLSELLAQSLDELTRPFDAPRGGGAGAQPSASGPHPARPIEPRVEPRVEPKVEPKVDPRLEARPEPKFDAKIDAKIDPRFDLPPTASVAPPPPREIEPPPVPAATPELGRADADKALAELEAELFAAAKQVDRDDSIPREDHADAPPPLPPLPHHDETEAPPLEPMVHDTLEADLQKELAALSANSALRPSVEARLPEASDSADASALISKVRRLMLVSMAVTVIAVGSVFGFIGYRMIKGEGAVEKRADKLPAQGPAEITLSIPNGAKVIQSAVANDRLVLTLDVGGKMEVRTFDVKTLQPAARLNFATTP